MSIAGPFASLSDMPASGIAWMGGVRKDGWRCTKADESHGISLTVSTVTYGTSRSSILPETWTRRGENANGSGEHF